MPRSREDADYSEDEAEDGEAKKADDKQSPPKTTVVAPAEEKDDWMMPIEFQSDIGHIHQKAGFTTGGE